MRHPPSWRSARRPRVPDWNASLLAALAGLAGRVRPPAAPVAGGRDHRDGRPADPGERPDGRVVWSEYDVAPSDVLPHAAHERHHLTPAVRPRAVPFDVDLGPDAEGETVATYSRCAREPPARDRRTGNAIARQMFRLVARARAATSTCSRSRPGRDPRPVRQHARRLGVPAHRVDGRIAFARVFERRRGRAGQRAYLYLRPNSLMAVKRPSRPLAARARRRSRARDRFCSGRPRRCRVLVEPGPTALDLRTRRLAFGWDSNYEADVGGVHRHAARRPAAPAAGASSWSGPATSRRASCWRRSSTRTGSPGLVRDVLRPRHRELRAPVPRRGTEAAIKRRSCGSRPRRCSGRCWRAPSTNRLCSTSSPACIPGDPCSPQAPCVADPGCSDVHPARCAAPPSWCSGPGSPLTDARGAAGQHDRALEPSLAVGVGLEVLGARDHLDERARDGYSTSTTTSQSAAGSPIRTCWACPDHSTRPPRSSTMLDRRVAVAQVRLRAALLELEQVEHHDRALVGRRGERLELVEVGRDGAAEWEVGRLHAAIIWG